MLGVVFAPMGEELFTTRLTVGDGELSVSASLRGNGLFPHGYLTVVPTPHEFATTFVGDTESQMFTVTNVSGRESGMVTLALGGPDASQFMIEAGTDLCSGTTLAPDSSCTVEVRFAPSIAGEHAAYLEASASPGGTSQAALSGTAVDIGDPSLIPSMQDFGSVGVGMSSEAATFRLTHTGGLRTGTLSHSLGGPDAAHFRVTADGCSGRTLDGGLSCTLEVVFDGLTTPGTKTATLEITDGTLTVAASLAGTSVAAASIVVAPTPHDFGSSPVGVSTGATIFTVRNLGAAPTGALVVSVDGMHPGDFRIAAGGDSCGGVMLPASGECAIAVLFQPAMTGARTAVLQVSEAPGGVATASLSGTGTP
jgi:hypothetical protein